MIEFEGVLYNADVVNEERAADLGAFNEREYELQLWKGERDWDLLIEYLDGCSVDERHQMYLKSNR